VALAVQLQDSASSPWTSVSHRKLRLAQSGPKDKRGKAAKMQLWQDYASTVPESEVAHFFMARLAAGLRNFGACTKLGLAAAALGGDSHAPTSLLLGDCFSNLGMQPNQGDAKAYFVRGAKAFWRSAMLNPSQLQAWDRLLNFVTEDCEGCTLSPYLTKAGFTRDTEMADSVAANRSRALMRYPALADRATSRRQKQLPK
jgi:hypothetical protein